MAVGLRATLTGDKKLARVLRRLQRPAADPIYRRSLRRSGDLVRDTIVRHYVSGQVVGVISSRYRRSFTLRTRRPADFMDIGTPEPRGGPFEFGWRAKNIAKRPHILPALERSIRQFNPIWVEEMERQERRA